MDNGAGVLAPAQDFQMEPPFARRLLLGVEASIELHEDDLLGPHRLVWHARGRDQQSVSVTQADVARRSLVDAELVHPTACVDDGLAFIFFVPGHRAPDLL
jgi:hypothetical protein